MAHLTPRQPSFAHSFPAFVNGTPSRLAGPHSFIRSPHSLTAPVTALGCWWGTSPPDGGLLCEGAGQVGLGVLDVEGWVGW